MPLDCLSRRGNQALLSVKVIPGASRTAIQALRGGELVVKVAAAPEKGKANEALIDFLSSQTSCPRSSFTLVSGQTSRHKTLLLPEAALAWLEALEGTILNDAGSKAP